MVDGTILLDVQQLIPLPEAAAFKDSGSALRSKPSGGTLQASRAPPTVPTRALLDRAKTKTKLFANISPTDDSWIATGAGKSGLAFQYRLTQHTGAAELVIDRGKDADAENKAVFEMLKAHQSEIETRIRPAQQVVSTGGRPVMQNSPRNASRRLPR